MKDIKINIAESVIPQLGQSLYKNIYGILIEYITNSYDADASIVDIIVDNGDTIIIKDDGVGMSLKELETNFANVGINKRKEAKKPLTSKGRKVTGRKGLGKLACFGFFHCIEVETIKDFKKSKLAIKYSVTKDEKGFDDISYHASISDSSECVDNKESGTTITLSNKTDKNIPTDIDLANSIAKRINLMYDSNKQDKDGFKIKIGNQTINKKYRDDLIINDYKFMYSLPKDIERFTTKPEIKKYFLDNNITGFVIARNKTSKIEENKGAVLFAKGKLCQEATFFGINQANSYGYAHLYAEIYVDFIDDGTDDNIGTDRTALNDNQTTKELKEKLKSILRGFATLYDEDAAKEKSKKIEDNIKIIKNIEYYKKIEERVFSQDINQKTKKSIEILVNDLIKQQSDAKKLKIENIENKLSNILSIFYSTLNSNVLNEEDLDKKDSKDNISTSYDRLSNSIKKKYSNYKGKDGCELFDNIYSGGSDRYSQQNELLDNLHKDSKKSLTNAMRELGSAVSNIRNVTYHTNDRKCYNEHINLELVKQYASIVDLLLTLDSRFFKKSSDR